MNWIKYGDKRVNLNEIVYISQEDFKRRDDASGEVNVIFSIKFIYSGSTNSYAPQVNFEFPTSEERDNFLEILDSKISV